MFDDLPLITDEKFLRGKRVLLRTTFNVPLKDGEVENDFRIRKALPTINYLREQGAKVVLVSHIWGDELTTLKPVHEYLSKIIDVRFMDDCVGDEVDDAVSNMNEGDVLMLENTRLHDGEVGNKESFSEKLAKNGDIYVNDAFPVSHREHASIVGIPEFLPAYIGIQFKEELDNLSKALNPDKPFLFVLGGAKFSTKIPLIRKFLDIADDVYVTGALVKPFLIHKGIVVHNEHVPTNIPPIEDMIDNPKLHIPIDAVCGDVNSSKMLDIELCTAEEGNIVDVGPSSLNELQELVDKSAFVLWNGPLGDYQIGYGDGTVQFAKILAESNVISIIGGGDTITVLDNDGINYEEDFTFTSTAGGAMLEFFLEETLPGIEIIRSQKK